MDSLSLSGPLGSLLIGAVIYMSPLSSAGIVYVLGEAVASTYALKAVNNSDQTFNLMCAGKVAAGAALGYYGAPYFNFDPVLGASILAPATFVTMC